VKKGYSVYLDYNIRIKVVEDSKVREKRKVEFLSLRVNHDYTKRTRIDTIDKDTWNIAQAILRKRQLAELTNDTELLPSYASASYLDFFKSTLSEKNHTTYEATYIQLEYFAKGEDLRFKDIDSNLLNSFMDFLKSKELTSNTISQYITRCSIVWRMAIQKGIIKHNPFSLIKKPKFKTKEISALTIEEVRLLNNTPLKNEEFKKAFLFACFTGLRFSDMKTLKWENVKDNILKKEMVKTKTTIYNPLATSAIDMLKEMPQDREYIFDMPTTDGANYLLGVWSKKAGIEKKVTFHVARHTFATIGLSNGIDLYTMSKLLGHKSIETTQVYAKIVDKMKDHAMAKMPAL
jgi:site-specific recombinase XerD